MSTFDQPNALAFALLGYQRQGFRDFEVVIADDGSEEATRRVIEEFRAAGSFPIKHVWQENRGFRKARVVNKAALLAEGRILLLTDGDCIPHRGFVGAHAEGCPEGGFAAGGHVHLTADYCRALAREQVRSGEFEARISLTHRLHFHVTHLRNVWGVLVGNLRRPKAYGRNLSVDRELFAGLNGYDNNFDGCTREDSDLRNRLRRHGARPVSLWGRAWVYHVDKSADPTPRVRRIPHVKRPDYYSRPDVPVRCENGLDQVREETGPGPE